MRSATLSIFLVGTAGCMGANEIEVQRQADPPSVSAPEAESQDAEIADLGPAFTIPRAQLAVLPFSVRLGKVARVAGVQVNDPILANMRAARLDLGDGDYANGIRPDKNWTAAKLSTWVKALRPVCQSAQLKARFNLPTDLDALIMTAHGRWADSADTLMVTEELAALTLTDDEKHELVCLSILSSTEFVSR